MNDFVRAISAPYSPVLPIESNSETAYLNAMPMTLDQIVEETRHMPSNIVAELVDRILMARHGGTETGIDAAWKSEISRRISEIEEGKVEGIPLEKSLARIRKIPGL